MREMADCDWFPHWMRVHQQEFLGFIAYHFRIYKPLVKVLEQMLNLTHQPAWTDACSGNGNAALSVERYITPSPSLLLTDKFPPSSIQSLQSNIQYDTQPLDILQNLPNGEGVITLFNAFHHFNHDEKLGLLQKVAVAKRPFLSVEILRPCLGSYLSVLGASTIGQWIFAPFIKPFRLSRILFTYLIPVHILSVLIDGWISVAKSPGKKEYVQLLSQLPQSKGYRFSVIHTKHIWNHLTILKGAEESA
jgi:hypothetical protein